MEQLTAALTLETDGKINANFSRVTFNERKHATRGFAPGNLHGNT